MEVVRGAGGSVTRPGIPNDRFHRAPALRCGSRDRGVQIFIQLDRDPHASSHFVTVC